MPSVSQVENKSHSKCEGRDRYRGRQDAMNIKFRETKTLWEGTLEQPALGFRGGENVLASIGEPFQWADGEMLGGNWRPPVGGNRFYLLQLAFTLSPRGNFKVTSVDFYLTRQRTRRCFDAFGCCSN